MTKRFARNDIPPVILSEAKDPVTYLTIAHCNYCYVLPLLLFLIPMLICRKDPHRWLPPLSFLRPWPG